MICNAGTHGTLQDASERVVALMEEVATQNQAHSQQMEILRERIFELENKRSSPSAARSRRAVSAAALNQAKPQEGTCHERVLLKQRMNKIKQEFTVLAGSNTQLQQWLNASFMTIFAHFDVIMDASLVAEARIAELTESVRKLRAEREGLVLQQQASSRQEARIEELEMEIENMRSRAAQLLEVTAGRRQAINEHAEEIRRLQEENNTLKRELTSLKSVGRDYELKASTVEDQFSLQRESFLLKEQLEFTTEELKKSIFERNKAQQRIIELQASEVELEVLRKERARQQAELDLASRRLHDSVFVMQSNAASNMEGLARELENSRHALLEQWEASQHKVEQLEAERDRLHAEMQLIEREYEEQIVEMERLHRRAIDSLRDSLHGLESQLRNHEQRINHLMTELASVTELYKESKQNHEVTAESLARAREGAMTGALFMS
eukprot:TRINITY_DN8045_c0_g1_i1.p2 TRINITY_DN8045_c0_g1~~TRINITY_DN8045_c0_g1_i1.p2  ORF type:complete len:440 (+),score=55.18 TRINITY_DN8045_c0_g1_i1:1-1320(+)